ncbi:MAG: cytochrome P450 [Anaerolineae bacterium]
MAQAVELKTSNVVPVERDAQGMWHLRGWAEAKAIMLMNVTQAGFGAEQMRKLRRYFPLSIAAIDGAEHRERRRQTAKLFTPTITHQKHVQVMHAKTETIVSDFAQRRQADLNELATRISSEIVFEIVGLTNSRRPGLVKRFEPLTHLDMGDVSLMPNKLLPFLKMQLNVLDFLYTDIRPAVAARVEHPAMDLISHMIEKKAGDMAILIEAITYGFAGMLTTREYICAAFQECMHNPEYKTILMSDDEDLRQRFLYEVIRLRPVTEYLIRRAAEDLTIQSDGQTIHIPAGELMRFDIKAINRDKRALGEDADELRLDRSFENQMMWSMYAFGYGAHHCPGETIAILETDIFLRRLFALGDVRIDKEPTRTFNPTTQTVELRDFRISLH